MAEITITTDTNLAYGNIYTIGTLTQDITLSLPEDPSIGESDIQILFNTSPSAYNVNIDCVGGCCVNGNCGTDISIPKNTVSQTWKFVADTLQYKVYLNDALIIDVKAKEDISQAEFDSLLEAEVWQLTRDLYTNWALEVELANKTAEQLTALKAVWTDARTSYISSVTAELNRQYNIV